MIGLIKPHLFKCCVIAVDIDDAIVAGIAYRLLANYHHVAREIVRPHTVALDFQREILLAAGQSDCGISS